MAGLLVILLFVAGCASPQDTSPEFKDLSKAAAEYCANQIDTDPRCATTAWVLPVRIAMMGSIQQNT